MKNTDTKLIRIPSRGRVLSSRGYVTTPITRPYRETLENILKMLSSSPKPKILEVLPNGRTVELTVLNFDQDNTLVKPEISQGSIVPSVNNAEASSNKNTEPPTNNDKTPEVPTNQEPLKEEPKTDTPEVPTSETQVDDNTPEMPTNQEPLKETTLPEENNNQPKFNKKNKNKNRNNNQQQVTEATPTQDVEVVPEPVE